MRSIWVARVVLVAASALLIRIGLAYVIDPRGAAGNTHIELGSNGAVTAMRVIGTLFVTLAAILLSSLKVSRLLGGLAILAAIAIAVLAMRLVGLAVDGSDPFTLRVLKPEIVLATVSAIALAIERSRRRLRRAL